jgi:hypothetical protein
MTLGHPALRRVIRKRDFEITLLPDCLARFGKPQ